MRSAADFFEMIRDFEGDVYKKLRRCSDELVNATITTYVGIANQGYGLYTMDVIDLNIHGKNPKVSLSFRGEDEDATLHLTVEI